MRNDYGALCYLVLKEHTAGMDSIYEDYIVRLIGEAGLTELRSNGYLETCGVVDGRQLYTLVGKKG